MEEKKAYESVLSIILNEPDVKTAYRDNLPKRSRFYQGLLDSPVLKSGKNTQYKELPSTIIIFITQEDIFKRDLAKYTFTEQCEEIKELKLGDGTTKIFLNMSSKNGSQELVSMLQYMKDTRLDNPNIIVKDKRILQLDRIVSEVKESEEWEEVQMNILEIGIEQGAQKERERTLQLIIEDYIEDGKTEEQIMEKLVKRYELSEDVAKEYIRKVNAKRVN